MIGCARCCSWSWPGVESRVALATELYERTPDLELGRLLGFFYDRVVASELGEEEFTYDLSVPENVTYVANGFVSHNTIGLMMDCDTTGVEPDLALTKAKKLVGGGTMFIVNQTIPRALRQLGYDDDTVSKIVAHIDEHKTILGAPGFRVEHLPVFACSMGDNAIHYMGHVKMMAAVQPFISGAISKTVNLPEDVSVKDVEDVYIESWKLGLKAVAIYRDNCKVAQPLATQKKAADNVEAEVERIVETIIVQEPVRQKLPRTRNSRTFSFRVADCHGYTIVGEYEDGRPGELFLNVAKQGSTLAGIMDTFAISVSHGLQYGVPLEAFVEMFTNYRFEPAGMTDDPDIRFATSLVDYLFRRLAVEYLDLETREAMGILTVGERLQPTLPGVEESATPTARSVDLPLEDRAPSAASSEGRTATPAAAASPREVVLCHVCGDMMQRAGSCYACPRAGAPAAARDAATRRRHAVRRIRESRRRWRRRGGRSRDGRAMGRRRVDRLSCSRRTDRAKTRDGFARGGWAAATRRGPRRVHRSADGAERRRSSVARPAVLRAHARLLEHPARQPVHAGAQQHAEVRRDDHVDRAVAVAELDATRR